MNKKFIQKHKKILIIILTAIVTVVIICGSLVGYYIHFLNTPANKAGVETSFVITEGQGVREISLNLKNDGFVADDFIFLVYLKLSGQSSDLQAGTYKLSGSMSPLIISNKLTSGETANNLITIPEGWTVEQIADYLDEREVVTKAEFLAATGVDYDYDFLADKPKNEGLEGFLFPDTYEIPLNVTARDIVIMMLNNFDDKLTTELRAAIADSGLDVYETVTLASIVEREASNTTDRKLVAGVFLNRLAADIPLESCATIQYITGSDAERVTYAETEIDSPYNTYLYPGLPVGPIGNPGLDSIEAVIYPTDSNYYYFLSADGVTYYSKTYTEHQAKVNKYLE